MKTLNLALNALILLSAMLFIAYIAYHYFDFGLFKVLPSQVAGFFLSVGALQYVALGLLVTGVIAKTLAGRVMKRQDAGRRP